MGAHMLEVSDLHCGYGSDEIVHGVSFTVDEGEFVCIIGANGCGKTTTLKNVMGLYKPLSGEVRIVGQDVLSMQEKEKAHHFAYIPQAHAAPFPFVVADVVILGRTPYLNTLTHTSPEDRDIAYRAMETLGIENLAERVYTELSGGQQQLVLIARALAQQPDVLIMDEPTASLDFGNQQVVLSQMKNLVAAGTSVLMVTHDPNHAFYCATKVVAMQKGRVVCEGTPAEVVTTEMLEQLYDARVEVTRVMIKSLQEERSVAISL